MYSEERCYVCGTEAQVSKNVEIDEYFYECPVCGRYEIIGKSDVKYDLNRLGHYLGYHRYECNSNPIDYRFNTNMDKEKCEKDKKSFDEGENINGIPVYFDEDMINNWYPRSLSQKIDMALLYLNSKANHIGQTISISKLELENAFFIDRYEKGKMRNENDRQNELYYFKDILEHKNYISFKEDIEKESSACIQIKPAGYDRIDDLLKYSANGTNVLVAMKFGEDTKKLREAIRKGISETGYKAIFIDEVEHNDLITPELLHYIRSSKFVVVDLTHQNNGAYFEEGYALGLGKTVIQLCQKDTKLHFDIAQKNTIIWDTEDDIPNRLKNRIQATID